MSKSFVFYESFLDTINTAPDDMQLELYRAIAECGLGQRDPEDVPYPACLFVTQAMASVDAAKEHYEKAKKDGAKGGRPKKFIDSDEAERLHKELGSWDKVADSLEVSSPTLYRAKRAWEAYNALNP